MDILPSLQVMPALMKPAGGNMRQLTRDDVEFKVTIEAEYDSYVGNCSAIDAETDAETEAWIRDELERGNDLAWCCVVVTAYPKDTRIAHIKGVDALGRVSCRNAADLYEVLEMHAMHDNALDDLNRALGQIHAALLANDARDLCE